MRGPAKLVIIPKIGLYAPVVESAIKDGEWQVPKFAAGHLQGTANPGDGGNVALSGHVQSISSGNVFARIDELKAGDHVYLRTDHEEFQIGRAHV
jgi:sortase A